MTAVLLVPDDPAYPVALAVLAAPGPGPAPGVRAPARTVPTAVAVVLTDSRTLVVDRHHRVDVAAPRRWRMAADVLVGSGSPRRAEALARDHPGALVVTAHHGPECWMRLATGASASASASAGAGAGAGAGGRILLRARKRCPEPGAADRWDLPWPVWASLVHAWLVAGLPPEAVADSSAHLLGVAGGTVTVVREGALLLKADRPGP